MWEYVGIMFVLFKGSSKLFLKGGENKNFFFFFYVSNLGGELVFIFVICFSLFILVYLYFPHMHLCVC